MNTLRESSRPGVRMKGNEIREPMNDGFVFHAAVTAKEGVDLWIFFQ